MFNVARYAIEKEPVAFPDVHVPGPPDKHDARPCPRKHPAEITTYSTSAHNRDAGPRC
jgi:hypothetical protein